VGDVKIDGLLPAADLVCVSLLIFLHITHQKTSPSKKKLKKHQKIFKKYLKKVC